MCLFHSESRFLPSFNTGTQDAWSQDGGNMRVIANHRDYKRIEWASREKSRDILNKSNGGSGI